MSEISRHLALPYLAAAQAQKHVTHNEALRALDALVQLAVVQTGAETPPESPEEGARYLLGAAPTGVWAGQAGQLALFEAGGWSFFTPKPGWQAWDQGTETALLFDGTAWAPLAPPLPARLERLGVSTDADATNRLAVAAEATLFTHAGAGHRLTVNKAGPAETASLLFQSNWSGRAELGLAGSDAVSLKISEDGSDWTEALRVAVDGTVSGAAVQSSRFDATPGRLMRADYGYGPATLLGQVGLAAGLPTGAVFERGAGWVRLADGTQIAEARLTLTPDGAGRLAATWTYPRAFASAPRLSATLDHDSADGVAPGIDALLAPGLRAQGGGSARVALHRVAGAPDFAATDSVIVEMIAVGRWV